jgi:hypothetical protein
VVATFKLSRAQDKKKAVACALQQASVLELELEDAPLLPLVARAAKVETYALPLALEPSVVLCVLLVGLVHLCLVVTCLYHLLIMKWAAAVV